MSKWSKSRGRRYRKLLPLLHDIYNPKVYILPDLGLITGREGLNKLYAAMAKLLNEEYGAKIPKVLYPPTKL